MSGADIRSWEPTFYPVPLLGFFLGYYLCAHLIFYECPLLPGPFR